MVAQNDPARKASEYPVHAAWPDFDIGAEYMLHSIPAENGEIFARDYLVVEVAIYPEKRPVSMSSARFALRMNGKKDVVLSQTPGFVAASLKYPDWEERPAVVAQAGPLIIGRPQHTGRFPGDPGDRQARLPLPRDQDGTDAAGQPKEQYSVDQLVARAALPEGEIRVPKKGALFFPFRGKTKSVRSLELLYEDAGHKELLKLF